MRSRALAAAAMLLGLVGLACPSVGFAQALDDDGFPLPLRGAADQDTQTEEEAEIDAAEVEAAEDLTQFPPRRVIPEETDPYAPLGLRIGTFRLFPAIEAFIGHSDNVFTSSRDPVAGGYYRLQPELGLESDWSRHLLRGFVAVDHESFFNQSSETTTAFDAELEGRLDITARDEAGLIVSYEIEPESRGDPNVPNSVVSPPDSETALVEGTYAHRFGRLEVSLRGAAEWLNYDNALLADGSVVDNSDRDYREINGAVNGRLALDDAGTRAVFVELGANRRKYRRPFDFNGVRRGSKGYDALVGIAFDTGAPLRGEIGIGYQVQTPDDPGLPDINSIAFRGSLVWQPTALTTVTFDGSILPEESILVATSSGALVYSAEVGVEHALRRNLIVSAGYGFSRSDFIGSTRIEREHSVDAGLEYLVSRWLSFRLDASWFRFESSFVGEDYEETRIEAGVRLQR